jgi:hypothetical protein
MMIEALRSAAEAAPFKPFRLHVSDGTAIDVASADHVSLSPDGEEVLVWGKKGAYFVIDAVHVTKIETAPKVARG